MVMAGRVEMMTFQSAPGGEAGGNMIASWTRCASSVSIRPRR